jgi:NADPH:quinone reductase-like Zn-dependent oxidoreductase
MKPEEDPLTKMRAVWFEQIGDALDVLRYGEVDEPQPTAGELLIDTHARVVQPADFMFRRVRAVATLARTA